MRMKQDFFDAERTEKKKNARRIIKGIGSRDKTKGATLTQIAT